MNSWLVKYKVFAIPFLALYVWLMVQIAWVGDDAHITFRSMENFLHGHGPVFNVGERVQTFTHPLWFLVQSGLNTVFNLWKDNPLGQGQMYFLNIFVSVTLSVLALSILVFRVASSTKGAILSLVILSLSKAFLDYSTSGLEDPLTNFLLILFISTYLSKGENSQQRVLFLSLLAALGSLNRLDTLLLYLPVLITLPYQNPEKWKTCITIGIGFLPLVAWELFSLFYYGALFPNTAYAKIDNGIPILDLIRQGIFYYQNSFKLDPVTLLVIFMASIAGLADKNGLDRPIVAGSLLYLLYILYIGGDFMSGRFFTGPLLISTVVLARMDFKSLRLYSLSLALAVVIGIIPIYLVTERHPSYGENGANFRVFLDAHRIADERKVYPKLSLRYTLEQKRAPVSEFARDRWVFTKNAVTKVTLVGQLGLPAYRLGPNVHVIDDNSLADPLMPRLPLYDVGNWRIGHYHHIIPKGYIETLTTGENMIVDKNIALYYDKLALVVRGDLWSWARIAEIWNLNTGKYEYLLENIPENAIRYKNP